MTMIDNARLQGDPIETRNWEPSFNTQTIGAIGRQHTTSVAINGSVTKGQAGMARAAANIARWKTYLPEECVKIMMNHGWHWST